MRMPANMTKEEFESLRRCSQDIITFLRLATIRIDDHPDRLPFRPNDGRYVIGWLHGLALAYGNGEDITK